MSYDILALAQGLTLKADPDGNAPDLAWLEESTRDPEPFWSALLDLHAAARAPWSRSRAGERFDFYHDAVVRNLGQNRAAFSYHDRRRGFLSLSFEELHARASQRAGAWAAQKVKPGDTLAIVLPLGPGFLVALLAALRMGLCITILFPTGDLHVAHRMKALKPDHITTEAAYVPLLEGFEKLVLDDTRVAPTYLEEAYTYGPGEILGRLFSPLHAPLTKPRELTVDDAYLKAVRDGLFAYSLVPGVELAAPGFHPLQHQPAMIFATLLAGASFLHISAEDVAADPRLLTRRSLRAVGITRATRDALLGSGSVRMGAWDLWFKNPEEPFDAEAWRVFAKDIGVEKHPVANLIVDASSGGAALISTRRKGGTDWRVVPAPGQPYALVSTNGSGDEAPGVHGVFAQKHGKKPDKGAYVVLARNGSEYAYSGTNAPRREGRLYPDDEVCEAAMELDFIKGACVVPVPSGGAAGGTLFTLLVFLGADPDPAPKEPDRRAAIERQITVRLGLELLPDRMEFFPLYPRLLEGKLDKEWCETQHRTGLLSRKSRNPMFLDLTALRKRCVMDVDLS